MGNDPVRDHTVATARESACGHPATWAADHTQKAARDDQYAARHDGFTLFPVSPDIPARDATPPMPQVRSFGPDVFGQPLRG